MDFDKCTHQWTFSIDATESGGPVNKPWKSFFQCPTCNHSITLEEKCALDAIQLQKESNKKQEKSLNIAMGAMVIGALATLISSFI